MQKKSSGSLVGFVSDRSSSRLLGFSVGFAPDTQNFRPVRHKTYLPSGCPLCSKTNAKPTSLAHRFAQSTTTITVTAMMIATKAKEIIHTSMEAKEFACGYGGDARTRGAPEVVSELWSVR